MEKAVLLQCRKASLESEETSSRQREDRTGMMLNIALRRRLWREEGWWSRAEQAEVLVLEVWAFQWATTDADSIR